jgi:hypothetical protein
MMKNNFGIFINSLRWLYGNMEHQLGCAQPSVRITHATRYLDCVGPAHAFFDQKA